MSILGDLDWKEVRTHYDDRVEVHHELLRLYRARKTSAFVDLLLGISNRTGNYSADDHKLGPKILAGNGNALSQVTELATKFISLEKANAVPDLIRTAAIRYLKIGVGSEASCMLNPQVCWVANTRTIWTHLVFRHGDVERADEELKLYRNHDDTSEMAYRIWAAIHQSLEVNMTLIAGEGENLAKQASVVPGAIKYIWADAIANALYASYYE